MYKKYLQSLCLKFISVLLLIMIWSLASYEINNLYILPSPVLVLKKMIALAGEAFFCMSVLYTFVRVFSIVFLALIISFVLAYLAYRLKRIRFLLAPWIAIFRSIPNATLLILFLFWFSRETTVIIVALFLLVPIAYETFYQGFLRVFHEFGDILRLDPQPFGMLMKHLYLPLLKRDIFSAFTMIWGLGFKVVIMAEILTSLQIGLGKGIQMARWDIDVAGVMAWTGWMLVFVSIFDIIFVKRSQERGN